MLLSGCVGTSAASGPCASDGQAGEAIEVTASEAYDHLIGVAHRPRTPDPVARDVSVTVEVAVDGEGHVVSARAVDGPTQYHAAAEAAARLDRFVPFLLDGAPVTARFVSSRPVFQEVRPTIHIPFPEIGVPADVTIAMSVSSCLGGCPAYDVAITGDGWVTFDGESLVAALGTHTYRADPAAVADLIEAFRTADFFTVANGYNSQLIDESRIRLSITIGDRTKTVIAQVGLLAGMPTSVAELEAAVGAIARTEEMIEGSAATVATMKAGGFDLGGAAGASALVNATECCSDDYFAALLDAGVALTGRDDDGTPVSLMALLRDNGIAATRAIVEAAIERGSAEERTLALFGAALVDDDLVRRLVSLPHDPADIDAARGPGERPLLIWSACTAEARHAFDLLMELGADPDIAGRDGRTLLHLSCTHPDWQRLFDAGADIEARDIGGRTPLMAHAQDRGAALMLLAAGANPNPRDERGRTPLMETHDADVARALLAAGADPNVRDDGGSTALMETNDPDIARALLAAGADVTLRDERGGSALDRARSHFRRSVVEILLAAGAE
jgi:ankyrin repeat protein